MISCASDSSAPTAAEAVVQHARHSDRITHVESFQARAATEAPWPGSAHPAVRDAFAAAGIGSPWRHQAEAMEAAHAGRHVVIATGTASGKSLAYLTPALSSTLSTRGRNGRGSGTLYLAPTKALANDQLSAIESLGLDVRAITHDGDSGAEERAWAREHGEYLLTNPDMLHRSMLPQHHRWSMFWRSLRYVVVDEAHHYRGVFGAHISHVLRRLRRICAHYGADPTFVIASATMADPAGTAERLTGLEFTAITSDDSPKGALSVSLWEPGFTGLTGENGAPIRRSTTAEVSDLLTDLTIAGVRTLAFLKSRRGAEQAASRARDHLAEAAPELRDRVASYRSGYLPEERRELERALRAGELTSMASTSALEMGIDISGLDAVLIAGFPGTRSAFWQQVGRAGRGADDATAVLIAGEDPLDTYLVHHPEAIFGQPLEASVFDPGNPYVLGPHLCAAAQELPLHPRELALFGPTALDAVRSLTSGGLLRRRQDAWYWTDRRRAADLADLRSSGGGQIQLFEADTGRLVGTVDEGRALSTVHEGAVYLHRSETWLVESLDLEEKVASMRRAVVDHSTSAREITDIAIRSQRSTRQWGRCSVTLGEVEVSQQVVSYLMRRQPSGEVIAEYPLDLPARSLVTTSVWWTVPDAVLAETGLDACDLPGAAHAAEHCSIGLLPLFATCDRWDIGGVSTARHPDTGELSVFVHDGHPGGAGFAERGFHTAASWLRATRDTIASCECAEGCPTCVQSPKCGNQNNPLDKAGAVRLLDALLASADPDKQ